MVVLISSALERIRPGAKWTLYGPTYNDLVWVDTVQVKPTEAEVNAAIAEIESEPTPYIWSNAQDFISEFSPTELAAIALSSDPTIAGLRFKLSTWFSAVWSTDPLVLAGMQALVSANIISETRKNDILRL